MRSLYCFSFGPKKEFIETDLKPVEHRLGTAFITFLSTDFVPLRKELLSIDEKRMPKMAIHKTLQEVIDQLTPIHTFFEYLLNHSLHFADIPHRELADKLSVLIESQNRLREIADEVFLLNDSGQSAMQRLCLYMSKSPQNAALFLRLPGLMRIERKIYVNGRSFYPIFFADRVSEPPADVRIARVEGSDNMEAAFLTEVLEMAEQNVMIQRCEYCHRYFLPYSSKARYCDHISSKTGKTCKELAAKEKHEKKIAADKGLKLIRQQIKAYDMRVRRAPTVYTDEEFQKWKAHAEQVRDLYVDGKLTYNQLKALTELPPRK